MSRSYRTPEGGRIDRSKLLNFTFDGKAYTGFQGDTLASALLANGVKLIARSFKYHRPRGIMSAGPEEPCGMIQLREGNRTEPNIRATQVELFDGLQASSQNRWPSVKWDINSINNLFNRMLPAGFYYKTFMWPKAMWMTYEEVIRHAAGMGRSADLPDPDRYEHMHAYCDVLVAGGGPAGLMAAKSAAESGARVILVDEHPELGGHLRGRKSKVGAKDAMDWVAGVRAELEAMEDVTILSRTTVASYYDHNMLVLNEHTGDHLPTAEGWTPRQRNWKVWAKQVVLATGSIERPLVFGNNDVPGVMLTNAIQTYANQYGVTPGNNAVIFTNNDSAYEAVLDMHDAGIRVAAVVDNRKVETAATATVRERGIPVFHNHVVFNVNGNKHGVKSVEVMALNEAGDHVAGSIIKLECDVLGMSGGWTPTVHLFRQSRGKLKWNEELTTFVPSESFQQERSAGACNATWGLNGCLKEGAKAGAEAAKAAGFVGAKAASAPKSDDHGMGDIRAMWRVPQPPHTHLKRFVDFQDDVATSDVELAVREGYTSIEHAKRYTTLGMGTDQGKTSNVNGLAIVSEELDKPIPEVGHTTFRPPYTAVTMGAITGTERGHHFSPIRRSPLHDWHLNAGATMVPAGMWMRAQYYQHPGEGMWDAIYRETLNVRNNVGLFDVSPLGKIDVQGPDAAEFLNRCYINGFGKLAVGKCRYGVMLREDGMIFDDGTTSRFSENHFMMTTTTAKAGPVMQHLEYLLDVEWPELNVHVVSVTEEWCGMAVAGPNSRELLSRITDADVSDEAIPFMGVTEVDICGVPGRIYRISFSGELAYEVGVPSDWGTHVWSQLMEKGADMGVAPYGTEAMGIMRIEKGHVVGAELNGRTTADDLGFGPMTSSKKAFIGQHAIGKPAFLETDRKQLTGLKSVDGKTKIPRGAQIVADPAGRIPMEQLGEVTANCYSPSMKEFIGLAIVKNGRERKGEKLWAYSPLTNEKCQVELVSPHMYDPEGEKVRG